MRFSRTLSLHVMRETVLYCSLAFLIMTLILLTQNLLRRLDEFFLVGLTRSDLWTVIECLIPIALSYSIPLAFLIGLILTIRRLSGDGELVAFRAAGIGPLQIFLPFMILALMASSLSSWLMNDVEHPSRRRLVQLFQQTAAKGAIVEPGKFRHVAHHLIFVEERERDGSLSGIMIYDQRRSDRRFRIFAERGRLAFDPVRKKIRLNLENGDVHLNPRPDHPRRSERMRFQSFAYDLEVSHLLGSDFSPVRPKQMTAVELNEVIERAAAGESLIGLDEQDPIAYGLELHRRRAFPFAPLLFAGFGIPLALTSEHRGRNLGLLLILGCALAYYAMGVVMEAVAEAGWLAPGPAQWMSNLIFGAFSLILLARLRKRIPA